MADPPKPRLPLTRPPPIPRIIPPIPAKTDVLAVPSIGEDTGDTGDEPVFRDDHTRNLDIPDAGQLVARMLDLVASEAEALLTGDEARLADLNVRTAVYRFGT